MTDLEWIHSLNKYYIYYVNARFFPGAEVKQQTKKNISLISWILLLTLPAAIYSYMLDLWIYMQAKGTGSNFSRTVRKNLSEDLIIQHKTEECKEAKYTNIQAKGTTRAKELRGKQCLMHLRSSNRSTFWASKRKKWNQCQAVDSLIHPSEEPGLYHIRREIILGGLKEEWHAWSNLDFANIFFFWLK